MQPIVIYLACLGKFMFNNVNINRSVIMQTKINQNKHDNRSVCCMS